MNTPTPAPSWPTRMAAIFNEWARRYSASPDSFGDVLGPDGKPVEDYGQRCATYFEQISRELYPSVKCTDPAQALANAALDWCEERGPRDRGDAELLKAMWNYSGDYVGPCAGCDGSCDEACAQSLTVAQAHAAIDRALDAHRAKIADVEERRLRRMERAAQQLCRQREQLLSSRIHVLTLLARVKPIADHFVAGEGARAEMPTGLLNATKHPDDIAVDQFAAAMKTKLATARAKGRNGWNTPHDPTDSQLAVSLVEHMVKGNAGTFEDVANFCMFLHQRGAPPSVLQHAALYTPASNFQRNTLLNALREVREALQFATKNHDGPIRDTIWMVHRPETLFDFIDVTLEGLLPESTATAFAGARNMLYAGLFEDETDADRNARLALAHAMTQTAKGGD
jgi:hypothetical protein